MEQLTSRVAYHNPWMRVREDCVRLADGSVQVYGVVEKPDFALVLPMEHDGYWLVEQFRYPVQRRGWEFPMGAWPAGRAGTARELADAELAEETGLRAATWDHLGRLLLANGFATTAFDVFVATDLTQGEPAREPTEADMITRFVSAAELDEMVLAGVLVDAPSLAALTLWERRQGGRPRPSAPGLVGARGLPDPGREG